jgi:hypothetical protein
MWRLFHLAGDNIEAFSIRIHMLGSGFFERMYNIALIPISLQCYV